MFHSRSAPMRPGTCVARPRSRTRAAHFLSTSGCPRRGSASNASARVVEAQARGLTMNADAWPAPAQGFVLTHFLVVSDQDRSREFYRSLFDGEVVNERDPVIMKVA